MWVMTEYIVRGGRIVIPAEDFEPALIFDCGQCFRFTPDADGAWSGVAFSRRLAAKRVGDEAILDCGERDFVEIFHDYLDLDRDYASARKRISNDDFTREAASFGAGIRILNQDFWEALCSFILSQCNNIARIRSIIERLCGLFGEDVGDGRYSFPSAEKLATLEPDDLAPLRAGYRAPYVISAARDVAEGRITAAELLPMTTDGAIKRLCELQGIGRKVASCVLLFGAGKRDAFPIDVWMKRALAEHYPAGFDPTAAFGEDAGLAQQYIFHYVRHLADKV